MKSLRQHRHDCLTDQSCYKGRPGGQRFTSILGSSLVQKEDAAGFFNLINNPARERPPLIITTNKAPTELGQTLDDEVLRPLHP